ncbi:MAG: glycogen phosphorylase [Deltaproteobacteria bacterium]|nr:glycogen phosphorylase [Deltaproteobacteria bacterium]
MDLEDVEIQDLMVVSSEDVRTGLSTDTIRRAILENLNFVQGRVPRVATKNDWYMALAYTVRDRMLSHWVRSTEELRQSARAVCYFSAEFLMGPHLANAMINLGIYDQTKEAVLKLGLDFDELIAQEAEPGLGNGGLGRLAACFLDSMATQKIYALGYGIRYEFGIFDQEIVDGWQREITDKWLALGNPWEIGRPEITYYVQFGGRTEHYSDENGSDRIRWIPDRVVKGMAYDTPVPGYDVEIVNILRLWKSEACESFDFQAFNTGDYVGAVGGKPESLHERYAVQLNDTHPSIAVAELMRLLVDQYRFDWGAAWVVTKKIFAYTNHTLLPEALEKWPISLFGSILPRHLEIIYEINRRFLDEVRLTHPGDEDLIRRVSLIDETGERYVRMAYLATVGSHSVNGVAALHTELLQTTLMKDFHELAPGKFHNVTNGITPRRWMMVSNPVMSKLITDAIGDGWICNCQNQIRNLEPFAEDSEFRKAWLAMKHQNKTNLTRAILDRTGITVDPESIFDIQVKRIHEYKRQHLNALHIIAHYLMLKRHPEAHVPARTVIIGGKAAPSYFMAKLMIKLITSIAGVVNTDPETSRRLKVIFFPDFNVKSGQMIYPAADISEQISTAGKEASGTGNMKFSMNGALTIGTLDGANVEIREEVGPENFFLFGLNARQVFELKAQGYDPRKYYEENSGLREVIDLIGSGYFSGGDKSLFRPLIDSILNYDEYMLCADYQSYVECQHDITAAYRDIDRWLSMSIISVARTGKFSSDRSILEYAGKIWNVTPLRILDT